MSAAPLPPFILLTNPTVSNHTISATALTSPTMCAASCLVNDRPPPRLPPHAPRPAPRPSSGATGGVASGSSAISERPSSSSPPARMSTHSISSSTRPTAATDGFFSRTRCLKGLPETCQQMKTPWRCSELQQKVGQFRRSVVCANQLIFGRRDQRPAKCPAAGHREHAAPPLPPGEKRRKTEGRGRLSRARLLSFFDVVEELSVFVQHLGTFEFPRLVFLRNAQVLPPVVTPLQHVEAGGSVGNKDKKLLAKRDDRKVEIVEGQYSRGGTRSQLTLCLARSHVRPGHVLPRSAPPEAARCSCGMKRPSVVRHLFVRVKLSLYSRNPS